MAAHRIATWPPSDEEAVAARHARRREKQPNRRIPDHDLKRVADVYRQAVALKQPPTREVERQLRLKSRAQAARWVLKARDAGYLGSAPGRRRAGEAPLEHEERSTEHVPSEARQQERPKRPPPSEEVQVFTQAIPPKREKNGKEEDE